MSEEYNDDVLIDEIESEEIETNSSDIGDFLDAIESENYTQAEAQFNNMVTDRINDAINQTKVKVANAVYGGQEDESPEN